MIYSVTTLDDAECASEYVLQSQKKTIQMLTLPLQICATRYYGVLTGSLPILHLRSMSLTGCSTVPCCPHVTTSISATPPTPPSPTPAPESASPTPSSAAPAGPRVQLLGGSATGGAWLGAGAASSPPAPGPPTGRMLAPPVHKLQWRLRRMNAVDNVRTYQLILERTDARPA